MEGFKTFMAQNARFHVHYVPFGGSFMFRDPNSHKKNEFLGARTGLSSINDHNNSKLFNLTTARARSCLATWPGPTSLKIIPVLFDTSKIFLILNLLEPVKLIVWKVVIERVTVIKFGMDNGYTSCA